MIFRDCAAFRKPSYAVGERSCCNGVMVRSKARSMRIPRSIHRFFNRLGPYQSLLILAVPVSIVEPLKLVALFAAGGGHFFAGLLTMIFGYPGGLFLTDALFIFLQ